MNFPKLKRVFLTIADTLGETITSTEGWERLMKQLAIEKLIKVTDMDKIDPRALIFPINFKHFVAILASSARPEEVKDFMEALVKLK